jgi:hypothetical protein
VTYHGEELPGLTLLDLSDREVLLVMLDCGGAPPMWITAKDVAEKLNLVGDNPSRSVSSRLSWLRRYGAVEREYRRDSNGNIIETAGGKPIYEQGWQLSELGMQIATGKISKTQQASLDRLNDGQLVLLTQALTTRAQSVADGARRLLDRQYRYGVGRR